MWAHKTCRRCLRICVFARRTLSAFGTTSIRREAPYWALGTTSSTAARDPPRRAHAIAHGRWRTARSVTAGRTRTIAPRRRRTRTAITSGRTNAGTIGICRTADTKASCRTLSVALRRLRATQPVAPRRTTAALGHSRRRVAASRACRCWAVLCQRNVRRGATSCRVVSCRKKFCCGRVHRTFRATARRCPNITFRL